jgi:hypothetical protein
MTEQFWSGVGAEGIAGWGELWRRAMRAGEEGKVHVSVATHTWLLKAFGTRRGEVLRVGNRILKSDMGCDAWQRGRGEVGT